ncbi:MAG: Na+/H+ antiporter subunit E [Xanthomonadales bacterium]|nr:Na+/H+ antiporter subunit E [Xanthomonadales bacterium]
MDSRTRGNPAHAGRPSPDAATSGRAGLLPAPITTLALTAAWILLNGFSLGHLLLGLALGVLIPLWIRPLRSNTSPPRRPATIVRLTWIVLVDIFKSNIEVARRILGPEKHIHPGWIWVPLDLRDPQGIAILAGIITTTPGTLSVDLSPDHKQLLVHCLHIDDPAETIAAIKARYERPLLEIFP